MMQDYKAKMDFCHIPRASGNMNETAKNAEVAKTVHCLFCLAWRTLRPWRFNLFDALKRAWQACLVTSICTFAVAGERIVDTIAGTGKAENNGDSGPAATINIGEPFGVEIGPDEALYITEVRNHRVRRLDLATRELTTVAGCGRRGYSGDGSPAVDAELNQPYEVRFDRQGNMYFVEMQNHLVRRVDVKTKKISTVAGNGRQGFSGDGGPAVEAMFSVPHSIAIDHDGTIYIADIGNHRIRRVDPKTGIVESIAGASQRTPPRDGQVARGNPILGPRALFVDGDSLWIALREGHSIWRLDRTSGILRHVAGTGQAGYTGDGGPAASGTFNGPKGIAVASNRYVLVTDSGNNVIRRIDLRTGVIATIAGDSSRGQSQADADAAVMNMSLNQPHGVCVAPDGALYIGDTLNHRVLRVRQK
jgi:streptogramin lyase